MDKVETKTQSAERSVLAKLNDRWLTVSFVLIVLVPAAVIAVAAVFFLVLLSSCQSFETNFKVGFEIRCSN